MRGNDMSISRRRGIQFFYIAALVVVAAATGIWWHARTEVMTPAETVARVEYTEPLPQAIQTELDYMVSIHTDVEAEAETLEQGWRTRLATLPLAPIVQVRSELAQAGQIRSDLEALPAIDVHEFAKKPPSRMWNSASRFTPNGSYRALPPTPGTEVGVGPGGVVAAHSGELCFIEEDMILPSRGGMGFIFRRYYRSFSNYDGPMGYGWDHNHNIRIIADGTTLADSTTLQLHGGDFEVSFARKGKQWVVQRGAFLHLETRPDDVIVISDGLRNWWVFEPAMSPPKGRAGWRLQRRQTRHGSSAGNHLIYRYVAGTDVLASVEDPFGQLIHFYYDGDGRLKLMTAPGTRVAFTYDQDGSLLSVTEPGVAISFFRASTHSITYRYRRADGRSWCISRRVDQSESELFGEVDLINGSPTYGRVLTAGYRLVSSPEDRIPWCISAIAEDGLLNVKVAPPAPEPTRIYSFPSATALAWFPKRMKIPSRGVSWAYEYNEDGLCIRETNPDGYAITRRYDSSSGDPRSRQNCLDEQTVALADALLGSLRAKGQAAEFLSGTAYPIRIETYQVDADGDRKVLLEERYQYNEDTMDLLKIIRGTETTWYFWNRYGQMLGKVDGTGVTTLYSYLSGLPERDMESFVDGTSDGGGVIVRVIEDAPVEDLAKAIGDTTCGRLDDLPKRTSPIPPASEITYILHDRMGRKIGQSGPSHWAFAVLNRLGGELAYWDSANGLTVTLYDEMLRRIRILHQMTTPTTSTARGYAGSATEPFSGRFYTESYQYDSWNRVVTFSPTDEPVDENTGNPTFKYERYLSGVIRELVDPSGTARVHEYDPDTGLAKRILLRGSGDSTITLREFLDYSPSGKVLSFKDDHGDTWTTRLDSLGRAFSENHPTGLEIRKSLDGLDRPINVISSHKGQIVDEQRWEYTSSGRLKKSIRSRFQEGDVGGIVSRGEIVVEEYHYDAAGRVTKHRGPRAKAWRHFFYDGLGRVLAERSPEGDWALTRYQNGVGVVRSVIMHKQGTDTFVPLREVTVLTDRFRPYIVVPVDSEGRFQWSRATIQKWSPSGRLLESFEPEGLHIRVAYDTRGNRVNKMVQQSRLEKDTEQQQQVWHYDAAGRRIAHETIVAPLALFQSHSGEEKDNSGVKDSGGVKAIAPRRLLVPQVSRWHYDSLGRLVRQDQPDGLRISREYGEGGGMVTRMTWRHSTKPNTVLRDIAFRYGPQRRLEAVFDPEKKEPLQEFGYDVWGNCNVTWDRTGHETVTVRREWDNFGLQCREQISYGPTILQDLTIENASESGFQRFEWQRPNGLPAAFWTRATYQSDRDGRVDSLSLNGDPFCQWVYQGQMPVSRSMPSSRTRRTLSLNSMGEVVGLKVESQHDNTWNPLSDMRYTLDSRGSVTASTVRLSGVAGQPESAISQYSELDAYRQIVAFAQEPVAWDDLDTRRRELLTIGNSAGAVLASRMHRDQAGNVFARYQGRWSDTPLDTAQKRGSLYSPGDPIVLPPEDEPQAYTKRLIRLLAEKDRLKLASNRLTSTANQGREGQSYKYDLLGQLSEYPGTYWDGQRSQPVFWSLSFDSLGRLTHMKAVHRKPDKDETEPSVNAASVAEVAFVYDADNRRIVKRVMDHGSNRVRREATLYCEDRQTIIMEQSGDGAWVPTQQYVWGASPAEALQVVSSPQKAGTGASSQLEQYAIHQDRGMNIVFATSLEGGRVKATPLAAYLDTGENSSVARISGVRSSMQMTKPEDCYDGHVDNTQATQLSARADWNWIEIQLLEARRVSGLTIWTDSFPNKFQLYALDTSQSLPSDEEAMNTWVRIAKEEGRLVGNVVDGMFSSSSGERRKLSLMECPYEIGLNGARTERLVILWQTAAQHDRQLSVTEFTVNALPESVASLGQNGAWLDRETGLYYQHHRYRLPSMNGKFISPDPLGFLGGPDLYAYANNNPLQWYDPDGRFAHILWGAGTGAVLNGGFYLVNSWINGEEISWSKLAIRMGSGALSGAVGAAAFGVGSGFLASHGWSSSLNLVLTGATTGAAAGFTGGFSNVAAEAMILEGRTIGDSLLAGLAAGGRSAIIGFVGGAVGGTAFSQFHRYGFTGGSEIRSLIATAGSASLGGAAGGVVDGVWQGVNQHGLSRDILHYAVRGALRGAAYGAMGGAAGWGMARASGMIRPLGDYPENLPRPRGPLIRTLPGVRTYGGVPVQPGSARHHITPLSLGGRDIPSNLAHVPLPDHRMPHPPMSAKSAPLGTIFY
ncbi:MAG: hypothetical protein D6698_13875 [Gammaproteobacteria bacterium]|nr:MAG: hypothetical protein D6698_13875 [Gammaproteobacteria bacterium]